MMIIVQIDAALVFASYMSRRTTRPRRSDRGERNATMYASEYEYEKRSREDIEASEIEWSTILIRI